MGVTTTFAALVTSKEPAVIALVEVGAGERFMGWTLTSGIVYETTVSQQVGKHSCRTITACTSGGVALTSKTSIATVQATPGSFWHDTTVGKLYVSMSD